MNKLSRRPHPLLELAVAVRPKLGIQRKWPAPAEKVVGLEVSRENLSQRNKFRNSRLGRESADRNQESWSPSLLPLPSIPFPNSPETVIRFWDRTERHKSACSRVKVTSFKVPRRPSTSPPNRARPGHRASRKTSRPAHPSSVAQSPRDPPSF
jgi:hypothetical protein